jgi:hypothetical protein
MDCKLCVGSLVFVGLKRLSKGLLAFLLDVGHVLQVSVNLL